MNADSVVGYACVIIALQPAVRTESICATNEEEELERHVETQLTVLPLHRELVAGGGVPEVITFSVTLSWTREYN